MPSPFIGNLHPSVKGFWSLPPTSSCLDAPPEPRVPVSPFTLLFFLSGGYWLTPTLSCWLWQSGYSPADYILALRTSSFRWASRSHPTKPFFLLPILKILLFCPCPKWAKTLSSIIYIIAYPYKKVKYFFNNYKDLYSLMKSMGYKILLKPLNLPFIKPQISYII